MRQRAKSQQAELHPGANAVATDSALDGNSKDPYLSKEQINDLEQFLEALNATQRWFFVKVFAYLMALVVQLRTNGNPLESLQNTIFPLTNAILIISCQKDFRAAIRNSHSPAAISQVFSGIQDVSILLSQVSLAVVTVCFADAMKAATLWPEAESILFPLLAVLIAVRAAIFRAVMEGKRDGTRRSIGGSIVGRLPIWMVWLLGCQSIVDRVPMGTKAEERRLEGGPQQEDVQKLSIEEYKTLQSSMEDISELLGHFLLRAAVLVLLIAAYYVKGKYGAMIPCVTDAFEAVAVASMLTYARTSFQVIVELGVRDMSCITDVLCKKKGLGRVFVQWKNFNIGASLILIGTQVLTLIKGS